jgi:hypothetical protein
VAEPKDGDGRSAMPCAVISVPASAQAGWRVAASTGHERAYVCVWELGRAFQWVGGPKSKADRRAKPALLGVFRSKIFGILIL